MYDVVSSYEIRMNAKDAEMTKSPRAVWKETATPYRTQRQAKQEEAISRWMAQGLAREDFLDRWKTMEMKACERKRMNCAFQKA